VTSFKVGCKTRGDMNWAYNALRFATREQAQNYAEDLYSRWMALDSYEVQESDDAPNRPENSCLTAPPAGPLY
jgi:hypothetical protein